MDVMGSVKILHSPLLCKVQFLHFLLQSAILALLILYLGARNMNEKKTKNKYEKRLAFQQKIINLKSEQIEKLESEIERLNNKIIEKDEIINSIEPMRKEMAENLKEQKKLKKQYKTLIQELKDMKNVINKEVYRNRWWLVRWLLK